MSEPPGLVVSEPWVSLSTPFSDEASPEWLLEAAGSLTHLHFEAFEGAISLACAFPLAEPRVRGANQVVGRSVSGISGNGALAEPYGVFRAALDKRERRRMDATGPDEITLGPAQPFG